MSAIYYVEVNVICIAILFLVKHQFFQRSEKFSAENIVFERLISATILLCAADMTAALLRGSTFRGSRTIIEGTNLVFLEMMIVISYLWMVYVNIRLKSAKEVDRRQRALWKIPLVLFTAVAVSNPFTHLLFSIDENNLYIRNAGISFHWFAAWLYLIVPTVQTVDAILRSKSKYKRRELIPLLYFVIPPFFASVAQMLFYGVTSTQVGITLSILVIFLFMQRGQIITDSLTGLNNRHEFDNFMQTVLASNAHNPREIVILMLDLNNFKAINDTFGHMVGDCALKDAAGALKQSCKGLLSGLFLCRYGGDEFLIVLHEPVAGEVEQLKRQIQKELEKVSQDSEKPYALSASIGVAAGLCLRVEDIEQLIHLADKAMYLEKKQAKLSEQSST